MSAGALTRALAPALGGAIFAASLDWRALGSARLYVVFVFGAAAAGCGALVASRLPPWMQEPPPSPAAGPVDLSPGKDVPMVWPAGSGRGGGGLGVSSPRGSPGPSLLAQADVEAVVPTTSSGSITAHSRAIGRMAR